MKPFAILILAATCALTPTLAHADDGGWLDWLYHMDNEFAGLSVEFHVQCWDKNGKRLQKCENWFRNVPHIFAVDKITHPVAYDDVKYELTLRTSFFHTVSTSAKTGIDTGSINAERVLIGLHYHLNENLAFQKAGAQVVGNLGGIRFGGDSLDKTVWAGIVSGGLVFVPKWPDRTPTIFKGASFHVEENFYSRGLTGAALLNNDKNRVVFGSKGERSLSFGVGLNLWRVKS